MNREKNIDFLKVICCFLVIVLHSTAFYLLSSLDTGGINFYSSTIISVFTRVSVPIFLMISGRYLIKSYKSKKEFYKTRIPRALIPLVFWNIFYICFRFFLDPNFSFNTLWKEVLMGGASIHLWYLYLLFFLYLLTPFIVDIKNTLTVKAFRNLSILILFIGFLCEIIRMLTGFLNIPLYYPVEFLGYFLMGFILKDFKTSKSPFKFLVLFLILSLIGGGLSIYLNSIDSILFMYFHTSLNPPVLFSSLCLYIFFNNLSLNESIITKLSKYTFGIYGIHFAILLILSNIFVIENAILGIFISSLTTFFLSSIVCILLSKLSFFKKIIY